MPPANKRWRQSSLIGWAQIQNDPCLWCIEYNIETCFIQWLLSWTFPVKLPLSHRWMLLGLNYDKSTLVQVMAWCCQAAGLVLNVYISLYSTPLINGVEIQGNITETEKNRKNTTLVNMDIHIYLRYSCAGYWLVRLGSVVYVPIQSRYCFIS